MTTYTSLEKADNLVIMAEKSLKVTMLKWRPDYCRAAEEFTQAAMIFRHAGSFDRSKDCYKRAIDCYKNNKSWFHAAKCIEQLILIAKDQCSLHDVEDHAIKACELYQMHGSYESAISCLEKSAKIVQSADANIALRLYHRSLDILMLEKSTHGAAETASKISKLYVKLKRYDQAADALRHEIGLHQELGQNSQIGRLSVALVLVQLARCDVVAAEKSFKEWGSFCQDSETETLEMILQAFDEGDSNLAIKALACPFVKSMDVEYALLARDIELPTDIHRATYNT